MNILKNLGARRLLREVASSAEAKKASVQINPSFNGVVCGLLTCLLGPSAVGAETQGKVVELSINKVDYNGFVFVRMSVAPTSSIACSINPYWHFTLPFVTETDKRMYAMLVVAQLSGQSVRIYGTGACSETPYVESTKEVRPTAN
jgi:formylmethanofuran dehydrogenase subunit B